LDSSVSKSNVKGRLFYKTDESRQLLPNIVPTIFKFEMDHVDVSKPLFLLINFRIYLNVSYLAQLQEPLGGGI